MPPTIGSSRRARRSRRSRPSAAVRQAPNRAGPMIENTDGPIDYAALTERVRSHRAGAVCLFLGTVRELTGDRRTLALDYEAYPAMARAKLAELEEEARRRWPIVEAALVHRVGALDL